MTDQPVEFSPAEAGYLTARLAQDYNRCVRELLGMTLWLPVTGPERQFMVSRRGDRRLVHAYTSPHRLNAIAGPEVDPAAAVSRPFSELVRRWQLDDVGLVVNPDTDTELQLAAHLFPKVLELRRRMLAETAETAETAGPGSGPDAVPGMVPVEPPDRIGSIRFASVVDGVGADGRPVVSPERPRVDDPAEVERIRGYLAGGVPIQTVAGLTTDMFDPEKGDAVPAHTRTDGTWVWSDALGYYLETYHIGPEPDFYQHISSHDYRCPEVPPDRLRLARTALREHQKITSDLHQDWLRDQRRGD